MGFPYYNIKTRVTLTTKDPRIPFKTFYYFTTMRKLCKCKALYRPEMRQLIQSIDF